MKAPGLSGSTKGEREMKYLLEILIMFLGALNLRNAIVMFNDGCYFLGALGAFGTFWLAALFIKCIFFL